MTTQTILEPNIKKKTKENIDFGKCKTCNTEPDREDQNGPCSFAYTYICQATNGKHKEN